MLPENLSNGCQKWATEWTTFASNNVMEWKQSVLFQILHEVPYFVDTHNRCNIAMCISVWLVNLDNKEGSRSKLTNLWICHSKWNYPGMLMEERTLKKLLAASSKLSAILFFLLVMFNTKAINMVNKLSISHYVYITMLGKQNISLAFARFSMPWAAVRCMIHCLGYGLPVNLWCPLSRDPISF